MSFLFQQWLARNPLLVPLLVQGLQEVLADRTHTNPMGQVVNALLPFANLPRCINCFRTWILSRVFRREAVDETEQDLSYDDIKEYFQTQGAFRPCLGMCRHGDVLGEGLVEHEPVQGWNPPQRKRESAFKGNVYLSLGINQKRVLFRYHHQKKSGVGR